jgi:RNA recognition motif-containing protein
MSSTAAKVIKRNRRSLGFGFVTFADEKALAQALTLKGQELGGRTLNVEIASPEKEITKPASNAGSPKKPVAEKVDAPRVPAADVETTEETKRRRRRPKRKNNNKKAAPAEETFAESSEPSAAPVAKPVKEKKTVVPASPAKTPVAPAAEPPKDKIKQEKAPRNKRPNRYDEALEKGNLSKTTLYVGNLPFHVTDDDLNAIFKEYAVKSAFVAQDPEMQRSKGFGFVEFKTEQELTRVLGEIKEAFCNDRPLRVRAAIPEMIKTANDPVVKRRVRRDVPVDKTQVADADEGFNVVNGGRLNKQGQAEEAVF